MCGEEPRCAKACATVIGTPPRVWGRGLGISASCLAGGDTPTCVGKSVNGVEDFEKIRDTPTCVGKSR